MPESVLKLEQEQLLALKRTPGTHRDRLLVAQAALGSRRRTSMVRPALSLD
jgi:hypothetical protein